MRFPAGQLEDRPPSRGSPALPGEAEASLPTVLDAELEFYGRYGWCVNPFPTTREVVQRLGEELGNLEIADDPWREAQRITNVFLLSCALVDSVDDYLLGSSHDFSKVTSAFPMLAVPIRVLETCLRVLCRTHGMRTRHIRKWRERWDSALDEMLRLFVSGAGADRIRLVRAAKRLAAELSTRWPTDLHGRRARIPAAFRNQDLTHHDVLKLAAKLVSRSPERGKPFLIVGFRTAGSYFAPLLRAYLKVSDFADVRSVTVRPKRGLGAWERTKLAECAGQGAVAVLIDEPAYTGSTLAKGVNLLCQVGFSTSDIVALFPVHPTRRDWEGSPEFLPLAGISVLTLEPEEWHKYELLDPASVEQRLREYYGGRGYTNVSVVMSTEAERLNVRLRHLSEEKFHTRLKRVYEVRLTDARGGEECRYVLAKSVGWGWLSYHAFLAAIRLARFVPPILGLRDGILYSEWIRQGESNGEGEDRSQVIERLASYVATRVQCVPVEPGLANNLSRANLHPGYHMLAEVLSQAYGSKAAAALKRPRIQRELSETKCPFPALIDGKMRRVEWIIGSSTLLKTDFEQHGLGKIELNMTDPAYDLAEAVFHFGLLAAEEAELLRRYQELAGDSVTDDRLLISKLIAGTQAMNQAMANLADPRLLHRHEEFNQQYVDARRFLSVAMTRYCGRLCNRPESLRWQGPLIVLDIDGVLDKQIFGFPSTTAAGVEALRILHAHNFAMAVNTARTLSEVKEYCRAYGFTGGVADYGSVAWDAVEGRERVLVSPESLKQLDELRQSLRRIPGVFMDEAYEYSIRAHTFAHERTVPLPRMLIQNLLASLKLEGLRFHQTYLDTAVLAKEVDKGRGLLALLDMVGQGMATVAIGDSESDLPMFRVATRCYAPAQISCPHLAKALSCHIADRPYQPGLLRIAKTIAHGRTGTCALCRTRWQSRLAQKGVVPALLREADQHPAVLLLKALCDPLAFEAFAR